MEVAIDSTLAEASADKYRKRIRAWVLYDWASSAFVTTVVSAVLPFYYSQVAGATLPSASVATKYWSLTLSISVLIVALISPILGTISDIMRGKKKFLSLFVAAGVIGTGLLTLVDTGDWLLASLVFILGRVGFGGANVFYDSLLPHVARDEDQDTVSTQGYAIGYLGGGLLLALNVVMIQSFPDNWGVRLSMLSVAIWWAIFSIPLFRTVPEPPGAAAVLAAGQSVIRTSFGQLFTTLRSISHYRDLFRFLLAYLVYNDGIGVIITMAAIYVAELGFGLTESVLAILLIQFVGIPYSLIYGRLPRREGRAVKPFFAAFIVFNIIILPLVGLGGRFLLPQDVVGRPSAPFTDMAGAVGEGSYLADSEALTLAGPWELSQIDVAAAGLAQENTVERLLRTLAAWLTDVEDERAVYAQAATPEARVELAFNGQRVTLTHSAGPDHGRWQVLLDGQPLQEQGEPIFINAYSPTRRYGLTRTFVAPSEGEHRLALVNSSNSDPQSSGRLISVHALQVLAPQRHSNLGAILGLLVAVQVAAFLAAALLGGRLLGGLAQRLDTRRSIMLALVAYMIVALWGYFLNSMIEFWFMAWMIGVVQGGSQALSRSLYATMTPRAMSGEFFGLFSIMSKFASFLSPLVFFVAVSLFDSSRPAILSIIAFFVVGFYLLSRVDVEAGRERADATDRALLVDEEPQ